MNEKFLLFIVLLAIAVALMFPVASKKALAAPNDTVTIDVNVSSVSQITVLPDSLSWTLVDAGTEGIHKNITIKNTGSLNITQIQGYVNTLDVETAIPYGGSDAAAYSSGGVLTIMNRTDANDTDAQYFFLGRIEWNWTQDIPNHNWTAVASPVAWGYFRNTTKDYVWLVGNGTNGYCNNSNTRFAIEDDYDLGTLATRTPTTTNIGTAGVPDASDANWTYFSVTRAPFYNRSCVAVYKDCSKIYIYAFDKRTYPDFAACGNSVYLYDGSGDENPLAPGSTIILKVSPWIAYGTPAGDMSTTTLTIEAV